MQRFNKHQKLVSLKMAAFAILFLFVLWPAQAQTTNDARIEAIESRRIAFLTEKMALTPDEARVFWPVYNEYNRRRDEFTAEHRKRWHKANISEMSNEEAGRFAEDHILHMERNSALKREYHEKLKRILPARKIALLYEAERDFNRVLFQEARRRARESGTTGR